MNIDRLKAILPLFKQYAEGRGKHEDQLFPPSDGRNDYYKNAHSAIIRNGSLLRHSNGYSYCFAHLFQSVKEGDDILIQIQPPKDNQDKEAYRQYIKWVVNDSPWAVAFVNKNINSILRYGVVILEPSVDRKMQKEAAIAIRMAWENYAANKKYLNIDLWWELAQKVNPRLAFIAGWLMVGPKVGDNNSLIKKAANSGHSPINYYYHKEYPNQKGTHITGWLRGRRNKSGSWYNYKTDITLDIHKIIDGIGASKSKTNPFNVNSSTKTYNRQEFLAAMYEGLPKLERKYRIV